MHNSNTSGKKKSVSKLSVMSSLRNIPPSLYIDKSPSTVRVGRLTANYVVGVQGALVSTVVMRRREGLANSKLTFSRALESQCVVEPGQHKQGVAELTRDLAFASA